MASRNAVLAARQKKRRKASGGPERRPGGPAGPFHGESSNPAVRARGRRERSKAASRGETPIVPYAPKVDGEYTDRAKALAQIDARQAKRRKSESKSKRRKRTLAKVERAQQSREQRESRERRQVKRTEKRLERRERERKVAHTKPKKFAGRKTAGTPTRRELRKARRKGRLKVNKKGYVVTPKVGKAARQLKRAEAKAPKASHDVAGIEDPEIRKAIIKHAPRVDKLARERYGISGEALLSKTVKGESNEEQGAVSSAKAKSITQFIPSTRNDFVTRLGVDPWRSKDEAVLAATMHLDGKHGYTAGLEGYNPGGGQAYVDYILDQPVGGKMRTGRRATPQLRKARRRAQRVGLAKAKRGGRGGRKRPKLGKLTGEDLSTSSPAIKRLGRVIAGRVGSPLDIISAARPGSTTTSGNVSDHSSGNAIDIHALSTRYGSEADQEHGNRIAYEAVLAAGGTKEQAQAMANDGGAISVVNDQGVRTQIIWRSDVGGDHHNHVHVGVSGAVGSGGFVPGTGAFTGGLPSGSVTQLTESTGMSAEEIDSQVASDPRKADQMLRKLGYRVLTPSQKARRKLQAVSEVDLGGESEPEPESDGRTLSALKRKYGVQ